MEQQVAEASPIDHVKTEEREPEPQLDGAASPLDENQNKKKKKKKKKNRRKSLEKTQIDEIKARNEEEDNQASNEETTVAEESTVTTEDVTVEKDTVVADEANEDELEPPSLERTSSLDMMKATGTKAVGSLFSRFKVGRKKSPKTTGKKLEEPEKTVDEQPQTTEKDLFGDREQSVQDKKKHEAVEKQEKEAEEGVRPSSLLSSRSHEELQAQIDAASEHVEVETATTVESSVVTADAEVKEMVDGSSADSAVVVSVASSEVVEETMRTENVGTTSASEGAGESTVVVEEETSVSVDTAESTSEQSFTTELKEDNIVIETTNNSPEADHGRSEDIATTSAPVDESESTVVIENEREETSVSVDTAILTSQQKITTEVKEDNIVIETTNDATEEGHASSDTTKVEPVSLKLDLDPELDLNIEKSEIIQVQDDRVADIQSDEVVVESVSTASTDQTAFESQQSETTSSGEELLSVKVTPTTEIHAEVAEAAEPVKMSPVKSLASRFEGKREQSLDTLKFRTVREFFPTERSIRVGAEKQKYEAQAQQQQQKAKAEEEAKSKYKVGSPFKAPVKESVSGEPSPEIKAPSVPVNDTAVIDESVSTTTTTVAAIPDFSTPDTAASRKKFSFDDGYASANSPSKFSDEALTPVKSIASRFEGKREQSLDNLKFRTVREFFPEERSVRVGSEKQKFEAQAQQDKSLDSLKFRTVREFFPDEGNRSIHVGAEKAKFEALTKQQEETAKAAEQLKLKHAVLSPTPTAVKSESAEEVLNETTEEVSDPTLKESQNVTDASVAFAAEKLNDAQAVESKTTISAVNEALLLASTSEVLDGTAVPPTTESINDARSADAAAVNNVIDSQNQMEKVNDTTVPESAVPVSIEDVIDETNGKSQISTEVEVEKDTGKVVMNSEDKCVELNLGDFKEQENKDNRSVENFTTGGDGQISTGSNQNTITVDKVEPAIEIEDEVENCVVDDQVKPNIAITSISSDVVISEQVSVVETETVEIIDEKTQTSELGELHIEQSNVEDQVESLVPISNEDIVASVEISSVDIQQDVDTQATEKENQLTVEEGASSAENGLVDVDLDERAVEIPQSQPKSKRPILTTERSFVIEDDQTIKTEDTVVVGELPMTDGEDEFEPLSPSKTRPAHELFAGINSSKAKKELKRITSTPKLARKTSAGSVGSTKSPAPKLTRKVSTGSVGSSKSPAPKLTRKVSVGSVGSARSARSARSAKSAKSPAAKTTVPVPMKRSSITAPTASYTAKKAAEAEELHKSSQLTKKTSASKLKGTLSETGFFKPTPASPTVPVPMKRASITAPTASYKAKKAAEAEELHKPAPPLKKQGSASKLKGTVSETGFIKQPPAAPTVPVPMRRASITAPTASWQARNVSDPVVEGVEQRPASKNHASKFSPTVPVAPKRASIMAPTASYMAKKSAENAEDTNIEVPAAPARNKRYSNVKSKVLDGIQSGSTHATTHKLITKEEFIAAERRKSLGSAGVRNVLDAVDRRASLTARVTIDGPPEPFMRSALSRKKLNSTVPRYLDYENSQGYADRARKQYERRKRLEEENAAKSEKRQRELRAFFTEKQQKSLMSSADEVRRGLEAHEFAKLAKESEIQAQKALRTDKQRAQSTRSQSSATSTAGVLSSSGVASRTSKKSSVSTASVEEKVVVPPIESTVMEMEEAVEVVPVSEETVVETEEVIESTTVVKHETVELQQEAERAVIESAVHIEEQTIPVPVVDDDFALEHVAKKIDFDEASSDSDEKGELNE